MTRAELLEQLNSVSHADTCWKIAIIREIVELHSPFREDDYPEGEEDCAYCGFAYPCPNIDIIERGLRG